MVEVRYNPNPTELGFHILQDGVEKKTCIEQIVAIDTVHTLGVGHAEAADMVRKAYDDAFTL